LSDARDISALTADTTGDPRLPRLAFYCVSSGEYFLSAVAMINSLRLNGHSEPIFMLDCGLTQAQREVVSHEVTVVAAPNDSMPFLLKTVAPLRNPAEVMVLIDADIIVTRSLGDMVDRAANNKVVAVQDRLDRFVPEWGELLGLGAARRRPYLSSSLVAAGGAFGRRVLRLMEEAQYRIDLSGTAYLRPDRGFDLENGTFDAAALEHPWCFVDQDILNAILCAEPDPERVESLDARFTATLPFTGVRAVDEATLQCAYDDGTQPYALHHVFPVKPWLEPTIPGVYSRLLERLLRGSDVAVRVPRQELPSHLRAGPTRAAREVASRVRGGLRG
jgi:hypothetical protein